MNNKVKIKEWLGKSVVVHSDGSPRILYHGTNQDIHSFDLDRLGDSTKSVSAVLGVWLSDSPLVASEYAQKAARIVISEVAAHEAETARLMDALEKAERKGDWDQVDLLTQALEAHELDAIRADPSGQNVMPLYVRLLNPHVVDLTDADGFLSTGEAARIIQEAKLNGCDGVIFRGCTDTDSFTASDHYVVFDPCAIKSACGNSGRFVENSPSLSDSDVLKVKFRY